MNNKSNLIFKRIIPFLLVLLIIGAMAGTAVESTRMANIRPNGNINPGTGG